MDKDQLDVLAKELQKKIQDDEEKTYSKTVIREYRNPTKFGILSQPDAIGVIKGSCEDTMKITLRIAHGKIHDARFWTDGCGATLASGNRLLKMIIGKTPQHARGITETQLVEALGGLPQAHLHCALLAVNTLRQALKTYKPRGGHG
jgi:nitrogen fixation protein NifU and related proteins